MALKGYKSQQKKELVVRTIGFTIIVGHLYKMGLDEILQQYVHDFEYNSILVEAHGGAAGGHFLGKVTSQKIFRARLWWLRLHKDSNAYCRVCDACQRMSRTS